MYTKYTEKLMKALNLGPRRVLWVVEVTISEYSNGVGMTPAATKPDIWDISDIITAFTSSQIYKTQIIK